MKMRILIGYDGSESADAALRDLRRAGLPRDVLALIMSVGELVMPPPAIGDEVVGRPVTSRLVTEALAQAAAGAAQALKETQEFAAKAGECVRSYFPHWEVQTEGLAGWPSTELINKADEWKADLVVVGSQGRSALGRFFLGSVSKKLATESRSSVRVVRRIAEKSDNEPPRIMIGVDGSPGAERAVRSVGRRVWPAGAEVRIRWSKALSARRSRS